MFDSIKSMKFSPQSTIQKLILVSVGDRNFLDTMCLNRNIMEIEEFKTWNSKATKSRGYKIDLVQSSGHMWVTDSKGKIVRFGLKKKAMLH